MRARNRFRLAFEVLAVALLCVGLQVRTEEVSERLSAGLGPAMSTLSVAGQNLMIFEVAGDCDIAGMHCR